MLHRDSIPRKDSRERGDGLVSLGGLAEGGVQESTVKKDSLPGRRLNWAGVGRGGAGGGFFSFTSVF